MTRSTPLQMVQRICVRLDALWRSRLLREESAFAARAAAIDEIELDIGARLAAARTVGAPAQQVVALERYAARLTGRLQARNCCDLQRLRQRIRLGRSRGARLRRELLDLAGRAPAPDAAGYDTLDAVVSGLLLVEDMPPEERSPEPEMVFYQPTPARVVLEMIEQVCIGADDLFYDLGSGLGQVPILVHLLTGASCRGIEFEPAYCAYARRVATRLKLPRVRFLNADLRATDYADGTVFFLYTPCQGTMLQDVLNKLATDTRGRNVAICTYGPCTAVVTHLSWLQRVDDGTRYPTLGIFRRA